MVFSTKQKNTQNKNKNFANLVSLFYYDELWRGEIWRRFASAFPRPCRHVYSLTHSHLLTSISIAHFYLLCDLFAKVIVTRTLQIAAMLFLPAVQCHNNNNNETKKTGHPVTCVSVCECVRFCILCIDLLWPSTVSVAPIVSLSLPCPLSFSLLLHLSLPLSFSR